MDFKKKMLDKYSYVKQDSNTTMNGEQNTQKQKKVITTQLNSKRNKQGHEGEKKNT